MLKKQQMTEALSKQILQMFKYLQTKDVKNKTQTLDKINFFINRIAP